MSLPVHKAVRSSQDRQQDDLYATSPAAVEALLEREKFHNVILEPCCGLGHISLTLEEHKYHVISSDKNFYGFGTEGIDFLANDDFFSDLKENVDIVKSSLPFGNTNCRKSVNFSQTQGNNAIPFLVFNQILLVSSLPHIPLLHSQNPQGIRQRPIHP